MTNRLARLGWALVLLAAAACASGPRAPEVVDLSLPEGVERPAVWVDVTLRQMGFITQRPERVYFARISGLNGSPCVPREALFDPALDRPVAMGDMAADHLGSLGAIDGEGGFGAGGEATCLYDEGGQPVWEPVLYASTQVFGSRAYLSGAAPGRYTAVAAAFPAGEGRTTLVYFPQDMIAQTEQPAPPGAAAYMGRYQLKADAFAAFDPLQERYREQLSAHDPNRVQRFAAALVAVLAESQAGPGIVHRAGVVINAEPPTPPNAPEETETPPDAGP